MWLYWWLMSGPTVPVYQWTHRSFDAADPWSGNRPARWNIVVYKMVKARFAQQAAAVPPKLPKPGDTSIPKDLAIGLQDPGSDRHRVLPTALEALWRAGEVRDEDLPGLLHRGEGGLKKGDYPGLRPMTFRRARTFLAVTYAVIGLLMVGLSVASAPPWIPVWQSLKAEEWVSRPAVDGERVSLRGELEPLGLFRLSSPLAPPSGVVAPAGSPERSMLAVVAARREKRLALIDQRGDLDRLNGLVLHPEAAGVPANLLAQLRQRYPDVDTDKVLCAGWQWPRELSPYEASGRPFHLGFGVVVLLISAACLLWNRWSDRRVRRQQDHWRQLLSGRAPATA